MTRAGRMKWASRIVTAVCIGALLCVSNHADALSFESYPGCSEMCWDEFWATATASAVAREFASAPEARTYRRHILRVAVTAGGRGDAVRELLRAGAPPNARFAPYGSSDYGGSRDHGGRYVLHEAARRDAAVVAALLDAGALPHVVDDAGRTPLHDAVVAGLEEAVALLLWAGADPQAPDAKGVTAMNLAERFDYPAVTAVLRSPQRSPLACGKLCEPEFWRTATTRQVREVLTQTTHAQGRSPAGDAPLHLALATAARPETVKLLLDYGADPNARNARDDTPLHVAARTPGSANAIPILLEGGAMLDAANVEEWTPLHAASERAATIDAMRALLDAGADPYIESGEFGVAPLSIAVRHSEGPEATALLLEYGAGESYIPIHYAAKYGHPETLELLLDRDSGYSYVALRIAASSGNLATMRMLLARGVDPDELTDLNPYPLMDPAEMVTPLHVAARYCRSASLRLLLNSGAKPDPKDHDGNTPLSDALWRIIRPKQASPTLLLEWRAKCDQEKQMVGRKACKTRAREEFEREFEKRDECKQNVVALVRRGADPNLKNSKGVTPLDLAKKYDLEDDLVLLLEHADQRKP